MAVCLIQLLQESHIFAHRILIVIAGFRHAQADVLIGVCPASDPTVCDPTAVTPQYDEPQYVTPQYVEPQYVTPQ